MKFSVLSSSSFYFPTPPDHFWRTPTAAADFHRATERSCCRRRPNWTKKKKQQKKQTAAGTTVERAAWAGGGKCLSHRVLDWVLDNIPSCSETEQQIFSLSLFFFQSHSPAIRLESPIALIHSSPKDRAGCHCWRSIKIEGSSHPSPLLSSAV